MDYLDNELPMGDSVMFRLHVLLCSVCRRYMNQYKTSVSLSKSIMDDPPPPELVNLTTEFLHKRVRSGQASAAQ
jgi:hypothetical protein